MKRPVVRNILNTSDEIALENRVAFDAAGIFVINLMASPRAGKSSFILATLDRLPPDIRPGVIEGILASQIDFAAMGKYRVPVTPIKIEEGGYVDAPIIHRVLPALPLSELDLLFIENVGNVVSPTNLKVGADRTVVIASVPEGHDKPYQYPDFFAGADAVILNKSDLIDTFDFDLDYFQRGIELVKPDLPLFVLSCQTNTGLYPWLFWLLNERHGVIKRVACPGETHADHEPHLETVSK